MTKQHHHHGKEEWMNRKWRPMMAMMYMVVCSFDFFIAPVLWSLLQAYSHGQVTNQWTPLTLQGAGLFHLSMGAVLGITAYGRTQEKLNGVQLTTVTPPTTVTPSVNQSVTPTPKTTPTQFPTPAI